VQSIHCGSDQDIVDVAAKKSQVFLEKLQSNDLNDYVLAMTAYALSMAKSQHAASLLADLDRRVQGKDQKRHHWTCGWNYCHGWRQRYCRHGPGSVETTAYALLAYLEMGRIADGRFIEAWLVSQMDNRGGYRSTQDTMMALMALSEMAIRVGWQPTSLTVTVSNSSNVIHTFELNTGNKLITQNVEIDSPTTLHFHHKGIGTALLQVMVTYNIPEIDPDDSFLINATTSTNMPANSTAAVSTVVTPGYSTSPLPAVPSTLPPTHEAPIDPTTSTMNNSNQTVAYPTILPLDPRNNLVHLNICSSWQRGDTESGMSIMEIGLLSGYRADQNQLRELVENNEIELQRYETEGRKVVLYFDKVKNLETCFSISQQRTHCVANIQPSFIQAYSYYEPDFLTIVPYQPPSSLTESLNECEREMEVNEIGTDSTLQPQTIAASSPGRGAGSGGNQESMMDAM
jgi:hydrogenase maturation factor